VLKSLIINNIVLIDKAEITFDRGLAVLSGETGSGKSILLDALGLAIGFRSSTRLIGSYDNKATIIAEFDITENPNCQELLKEHSLLDLTNSHHIIIRRIITENSASKVYVNDNPIGVNLLAKIGETLVEIHGQHEQQGLLNANNHLAILDEFANNQDLVKSLKNLYEELSEIDKEIAEFDSNKLALEREKDYLEYAIDEINQANIIEDEEQILLRKREQLNAQEKINNFISEIKNCLLESSSNLLQSQKILSRNFNLVENFIHTENATFASLSENSDRHITEIDEAIKKLEIILREVNSNHESKEEIDERLFLIRGLARKYNSPINDLAKLAEEMVQKLSRLNNLQQNSRDFATKRAKILNQYQEIAQQLSVKRQQSATILASKVEEELEFLKMKGTKFLVEIINNHHSNNDSTNPREYFANGFEKVKFKASLNKNNFDEITKIASGGELSRFMLALKVALINVRSVPTIIFDEIDTGISGSTSDAVGKRLRTLSKQAQILVVTHQPQISSKADNHYQVSKSEKAGKIATHIELLDIDRRINEVARMLSGENISDEAKSVAKKMIEENFQ